MRKIWARIGISLYVDDKRGAEFLDRSFYNREDVTLTHEEALEFVTKGTVDGDSYIPEGCVEHDS